MIIQIIGLPGAGKTTLAESLKERINAIHLNADTVRATVNADLGFTSEDREEHARRLGGIARLISDQGFTVVVDFICPTSATRKAFGLPDYLVWVDRTPIRDYADTTTMWEEPDYYDLKIEDGMTVEEEVDSVIYGGELFDWSAPTTLQLGRYQPWHEGHQALKEEAHKRTSQVLVGVRNTFGTSEKDPLPYRDVEWNIRRENMSEQDTLILRLPNITNIVYGRDVGYHIEQVSLGKDVESISATQKRKELGL